MWLIKLTFSLASDMSWCYSAGSITTKCVRHSLTFCIHWRTQVCFCQPLPRIPSTTTRNGSLQTIMRPYCPQSSSKCTYLTRRRTMKMMTNMTSHHERQEEAGPIDAGHRREKMHALQWTVMSVCLLTGRQMEPQMVPLEKWLNAKKGFLYIALLSKQAYIVYKKKEKRDYIMHQFDVFIWINILLYINWVQKCATCCLQRLLFIFFPSWRCKIFGFNCMNINCIAILHIWYVYIVSIFVRNLKKILI